MPGRFLIDVTDSRFLIPVNAEVIEFIRRANPFAHTDVGDVLFDLGRQLGALAYCPSHKSCAYVVLHTATSHIFAIAYGQRGLAFRLSAAACSAALDDGAELATTIGADWVAINPWATPPTCGMNASLGQWAERAFAHALEQPD